MEQQKLKEEYEKILQKRSHLILFNDDFSTFDYVIESLVSICDHNPIQAEQCAAIVHYNGECVVKIDYYDKLFVMYKSLLERNLKVEIKK